MATSKNHEKFQTSQVKIEGPSSGLVLENGVDNRELERKLKELSLKSESGNDKPVYLGDDQDYSRRPHRSVMTPSPRQDERSRAEYMQETVRHMAGLYRDLLVSIGEDPAREGLRKTPERAAKALLYFTKGYDEKISGKTFAPIA